MSGPDARTSSDDGANQVWGLICTLVAGPAVWGGAGLVADRAADTAVFTPVGVVVGFLTGFYIVYVKTQHQSETPRPEARKSPQHGRSEVPPRDASRPEPGDVR